MELHRRIEEAAARIGGRVRRTPVERSRALEDGSGEVWLKLEHQQLTGSFKLRGATNFLLSLDDEARSRGVVAASSGNHGLAVAHAGAALGCPVEIFVPTVAEAGKVAAIRELGVTVREVGDDGVKTEIAARRHAEARGARYLSPYNDPRVVAGQGTVGLELAEQVPELDAVYVALGGGGLIAGIGACLAARTPGCEIVACSPRRSPVMARSLEAGRILELESEPTLSDGTAGGVEPGAITFELCRRYVGRSIEVDEVEIAAAMRLVASAHHQLIEGAAGVAVAAFLCDRDRVAGRRVAIVLCGANVSLDVVRRVLCTADA